jgi:hypothetical protein
MNNGDIFCYNKEYGWGCNKQQGKIDCKVVGIRLYLLFGFQERDYINVKI